MKRFGWGEAAAVVGIVLIVAAVLFPVFVQGRSGHRPSCLFNLKRMANGLLSYASAHEDRLPGRDAWMEGVGQSVTWKGAYRCPQAPKGAYGYAFNSRLGGTKPMALDEPTTTPMVYDSVNPIWNASDRVTSLPIPGWHDGGNNVGYVDGHVKRTKT